MYIKKSLIFVALYTILSSTLFGITLKESVVEVLDNNPVIVERLKNFRATQQDLNIAESEYYPSLDLSASIGHTDAGNIKDGADSGDYDHSVTNESYGHYETSLTLTQNLFDGFGTMYKVDYEEARILAAAHKYIEKSNDMAFKMTNSYINVMRTHELTQTARENVQINESIYSKVRSLFDSGLTSNSEVKKIQSALSLARSNLIVKRNNFMDAKYEFRRILGRMPQIEQMKRPDFEIAMPHSIERAAMYSIKHNPSLLVSQYNIKAAQALRKQRKKDYYPKIDFELSQSYDDVEERNSFDSPDDRFRARIVLTYNFFSGGKDKANVQKHISKINQEVEIKRDLKRQVIEGLDLSWNAYEMVNKQLKHLKEYSVFSEETLNLYKEEYDLGRRSLLDLLTAQNDVINSRSQIVTAEYEELFARYRILDAMGLLVVAVAGDSKDLTSKVNLYNNDIEAHEILDTIPVKLDVDNDNVSDNLDLCDNSLDENNIMPFGCKKIIIDGDEDGVSDSQDSCQMTPLNAKVSKDGCALDIDNDGVKDYEDKCLDTPKGHEVDQDGCNILSLTINSNFQDNSKITSELSNLTNKTSKDI